MSFSGSPTLAKLRSLQSGAVGALHPVAASFAGDATLAPLEAAGVVGGAAGFSGSPSLAKLAFSGHLGVPGFFAGASNLGPLGCVGLFSEPDLGLPVGIRSYTGPPRATGGMLLQFSGQPNRAVDWSIIEGSGAIAPLTDSEGNPITYTDKYGRAFARYDAGGYSGPLTVEVEYGA